MLSFDIFTLIGRYMAASFMLLMARWPTLSPTVLGIALAMLVRYWLNTYQYHRATLSKGENKLPPMYPALVPWLGNAISFLLNNAGIFRAVTSRAGKLTSSRITVAGHELFILADRPTLKKVWKTKSLSSPIPFYVHVLKHFFGMHNRAIDTYRADNSGPFPQPFPGSKIQDRNRIDHFTHQAFIKAFTGPTLVPMTDRFMRNLTKRCEALDVSLEWTEYPDFMHFVRMVHGSALIETIFGPSLLEMSPNFMENVWRFDDTLPWLARLVPSFINPEPYRTRKAIHNQLKHWYSFAREKFTESSISDDGDGDPFWGSELIRGLHERYAKADGYDDDALASADLALIWGTVANATPTTMLCIYHVYKDPMLLERVRKSLDSKYGQTELRDVDPSDLIKSPLLSAIQAEVLRLYTAVCVMVTSPYADVSLGRWRLPKGATALVHSGVTHFDEEYWNTKDGLHPVRSFWADRFLTYPEDISSGPVKQEARGNVSSKLLNHSNESPSFSLEGLEASWMPYGGGNAICPGRFLAKRTTLFTILLMIREFDIEFSNETLEMGSWKFGMGVEKPRKPIAFRMRRRL